ncbi:MAG: thiamine-phosphate pyrophosphorylase [Chitinivibrionales bacterium]|nr:thiamine-phosphate pyrophosphorylase [Chitinivibrionales bacterium]
MLRKEESSAVYRILDANINRLREGLRVIEEYARFAAVEENVSLELKSLRHSLRELEDAVGRDNLLNSRDTVTDPFSGEGRAEEFCRRGAVDVCIASFRRAQEAGRVLEEYIKVTTFPEVSNRAKAIRFALYDLEKRMIAGLRHDGRAQE